VTRVSILTPAYKPDYFAEALRSALAQSHVDFEHVICDDSPGEEIAAIVRAVAGDDPRVRYVRNPSRLGERRNYLRCFELARGEHIKYLNDDDLLAPDCLARMSAALDAHPAVTLVTSYRRLIDAAGRTLPDTAFNRHVVQRDSLLDGRGLLDLLLRRLTNVIGEPTTVMFRRADLAANQPDLMSYGGRATMYNGDTYMWTTLLARGDAVYFAEPLSCFRCHGTQVQRDPAFTAGAQAAWHLLVVAAGVAGVYDPQQLRPLAARPLDPLRAIVQERLDGILARARGLALTGELEAAELDLREILASDPHHPEAWSDLSCVLWQVGERGRAVVGWRRALREDPDHCDATVNLASALLATGHAAAASVLCRDFLVRTPWADEVREVLRQADLALRRAA
jgi:glycosyltransferase involved in cell wall biosynthesis